MEKDLRILEDLKAQIDRGSVNFKKAPKERITETYIKARLDEVENQYEKLASQHQAIISNYSKKALAEFKYTEIDLFDEGCEAYLSYKGELNEALKRITPSSKETSASTSHGDCNIKLPKISIPLFNGNYSDWSSFKDLFNSLVHNNSQLDDVQRLHYLKTQLRGEAEQLIKHIPITQGNYKKCWEMLSCRYDNKRFMSNCILKRLFGQPSMTSESAQALKELSDTTSNCLHELANLGIKVEHWSIIIIYVVSLKLDPETRKQWELFINTTGEDLPSFNSFQTFLESQFHALEFVETGNSRPKFANTSNISHKSSNARPDKRVLYAASQSSNNVICPHCRGGHNLHSCSDFTREDVPTRRSIVQSLKLCFNCLGNNHFGRSCWINSKCQHCRGRHHTLLHESQIEQPQNEQGGPPELSLERNESGRVCNHFASGQPQTLLATALIRAEARNGSQLILRALLDQGSQASFISEAAVQLLQLTKTTARSCISGLGNSRRGLTSKSIVMVNIQSPRDPTFKRQVKAHVLKTVTAVLPGRKFTLPEWTGLGQLPLADPQYSTPNKIDILLGADIYSQILKQGLERSPDGRTIAQDTYFGWILSGRVGSHRNCELILHNRIVNLHLTLEDEEAIKRFWDLESEPSSPKKKILSPEELACENHFKATTRRDEDGRYIVELPFRLNAINDYGDTRSIAVRRLMSLEKRLAESPEQKREYSQVLREYLSLGHMEEVKLDSQQERVWLPHHAVIRLDKVTTRTRVVFNASNTSPNGVSLNSTLMIGPTLQPELRHTIMRWRLHPVCLIADIVKMYRQIKVAKKHVDYQRIVWRENVDEEILDFRLLTVTFGTSCAPYLAVKVLQQVAIDEGLKYPLAACRVATDFYMDDLLTGCQSEEEALLIYEEMNALLKKGGFILQKWSSNKVGLLAQEEESNMMTREFKEDEITKVVGLKWNRQSDDFVYSVNLSLEDAIPTTKRQIMAEICRLYDPLGWIAPCIIKAKIFIQKLWITGLGWDDRLPEELLREWALYRIDLSKLMEFHIPRWVETSNSDIKVELHGFSDASNAAYAAVVYIRCVTRNGTVKTHLISSKTKVAPIKQISIPRLELCGAVLLAKLILEVAEVLNISKSMAHAWTDSTVVLAWLNDHPNRWKTFVANRTSEILNILDPSQWAYVQSEYNPADLASRGISASELMSSTLWKCGPKWLGHINIVYEKPLSIYKKTELEVRNVKVHMTVTNDGEPDILTKYSSLRRLSRVVAYCRRFLHAKKLKTTQSFKFSHLTASEIEDALICCVRLHQQHALQDEFARFLKHQSSKNNKLSTLNPFIDNKEIIRVGGRIENANVPDSSKHPIIIDGDSHLAKLIVAEAHERTMHGGQLLTCMYVRAKYWVIRLKTLVRSHIHHCVPCIRNAAKTRTQLMGQLPSCRVIPNKPFLYSGVDYAGPINIRTSKGRGHKSYKGYICLFVCMATRAVHIEAVTDLTSEGFLAAFRRFVSRRGRVVQLWSDNGTNFVGAARELKNLLACELSQWSAEIAAWLANNGTEWRFIPPHAPHFGGLWEAGIKSTKHHLKRALGDYTLTYEEFATVLCQVEACLNSRPLSQLSSDQGDPAPLTPGHFLVGEPLLMPPDYNHELTTTSSLRRWQVTQRITQQFWKRWSQEYLTQFFQRYKWRFSVPELKKGDVVLVKEDNLPPSKWLYGLIVNVHPGKDDLTRVVTLKCRDTLIQRPISKLCPLSINDNG